MLQMKIRARDAYSLNCEVPVKLIQFFVRINTIFYHFTSKNLFRKKLKVFDFQKSSIKQKKINTI